MAGQAVIGALRVDLTMDTAAFQRGTTMASKQASDLGKKLEGFGSKVSSLGAKMALGITLPFAAFAKGAFTAASNAAELDSAFTATFGKLSKQMDAWAEKTGNAMGRSTREIKEGANAFGLYFNQAAKTDAEAAKMSQTFTVLAQDLSSFHNTSVPDALLALRSGLSGETEPLRKYGVFLNEAAVSAKAAEMGLKGVNGKLTDQEKIMARAALIMDATTKAQGDVIRTSGGTANQLRASAAAWEELQIVVGTKILPLLTPLIAKFGEIVNKLAALDPVTQKWVVGIAAVAAAAGPIMMVLGPIIGAMGKLAPLLVTTGTAAAGAAGAGALGGLATILPPLALAIGAVYLAVKNWDTIGPIVSNMATNFQTKMAEVQGYLDGVTQRINDFDKRMGTPTKTEITDGIGKAFKDMFADVNASTDQAWADIQKFDADLAAASDSAWKTIQGWDANIAASLRSAGAAWEDFSARSRTAIISLASTARDRLIGGLASVWNSIKEKTQAAAGYFRDLWDKVVGHSYIPDMVDGIAHHIGRLDAEMVEPVKASTKGASKAMKEMADSQYKTAKATFDATKDLATEMGGLLQRLFPQETAAATFARELAFIEKNAKALGLTAAQTAEAVKRLRDEYAKGVGDDPAKMKAIENYNAAEANVRSIQDRLNPGVARQRQFVEDTAALEKMKSLGWSAEYVNGEIAKLRVEYAAWVKDQETAAGKTKATTAQIAESFANMVGTIAAGLQTLAGQVKGGDWLGALTTVASVFAQVAPMFGAGGAFGPAAVPGAAPVPPGFAQGGSFKVGGRPGVDQNLVQMRLTKGERVDITPERLQGGPGGGNVFDLRGAVMTEDLLAQMNSMAQGAEMRGAIGGARLAQAQSMKRGARRLA